MAIASVTETRQALLKRANRSTRLKNCSNELEIFYYLCEGRVYFNRTNHALYFVDSPTISISNTITKVFKGLNESPNIEQLYIDVHSLFNAAFKIELSKKQSKVLLVALELRGINIEIS